MDTLLNFLQTKYIRKLDCNLRFLLDKFSIEEIVKEIIGWLKVDSLNYFDITTFARDFYIGSNLTEKEKEKFYNELERQGFFLKLNVNTREDGGYVFRYRFIRFALLTYQKQI